MFLWGKKQESQSWIGAARGQEVKSGLTTDDLTSLGVPARTAARIVSGEEARVTARVGKLIEKFLGRNCAPKGSRPRR